MSIVNIDYIFKITVIGNVCTGKTTLIEQLKYPSIKSDNEIYLSTIGVEYQTVMMKYEKEQKREKCSKSKSEQNSHRKRAKTWKNAPN